MALELVYLEWIDSAGDNNWQMLGSRTPGYMYCMSVGWIVREDDVCIMLAASLATESRGDPPGMGSEWIDIPKVAITRRLPLSAMGANL